MAPPLRFTACTYNLWGAERWNDRHRALNQFVLLHQPDILCVQELRPASQRLLDDTLGATHQRVDDAFRGWAEESNIYWNHALFQAQAWGATAIGHLEPLRRLFWVRLQAVTDQGSPRTLFVATVHYTWPGNSYEHAGGANVRIPQVRATVQVLNEQRIAREPQLLMGDLNDQYHVLRILAESDFTHSFQALGRPPQSTWPALPTAHGVPFAIDWMFHRGPIQPMSTEAVDFFVDDTAPSDHKPVLATYRLLHDVAEG